MRKILIGTIVLVGLLLSNVCVIAEPVIEEISLSPADPEPNSTITFTANISGDTITGVYLSVVECKDSLCFLKINESMSEIDTGLYQIEITLARSDANNIKYWLVINSNGKWYDFWEDPIEKDLKISSGDGGSDTNGDDGSQGTPGFEIMIILLAIAIFLLIVKRKRA